MARKEALKTVVIVNRFGPFDKDITGKSLFELGQFLEQNTCKVIYICVRESNKSNAPAIDRQQNVCVGYVPAMRFGNKALFRLIGAFVESMLLFIKTLFQPADMVVIMSAPAMFNTWGIWLKKLTGRRVTFWTMDLYPEAFEASGLIKSSSLIYKLLKKFIYNNPPHGLIVLGEKQKKYLDEQYGRALQSIVLPCGINNFNLNPDVPYWIEDRDKTEIKFCYAGNLGEAHDASFIVAFAKELDPSLHRLYVNLYGTKADKVLESIGDLPVVQQIGFLPYNQMHHLDVHIATLLKQWDHVCVPSKAVSAICAGGVLLLNTSSECDAWHMFANCSFWIEQKNNYGKEIKGLIASMTRENIARKKVESARYKELLPEIKVDAFQKFYEII